MFIGAALLGALGIGLFIALTFTRKRLATFLIARPKKVGELLDTARSIGQEIGGGGFSELVEVTGTIGCAQPLTSPLGGKPCVRYSMRVVREYEEDVEERDSQGKVTRRTRRGSETLQSDDQRCDFAVRDATGELPVVAAGADFDGMVQSVSRFESGAGGTTLSFGGFRLSLDSALGARRRTLGYRFTEEIYPLDRQVTVIALASDADGRLALRKGEMSFVVSTRSRQELVGSAQTQAKVLGVCGTLSLVAAVVLAILGLVRG